MPNYQNGKIYKIVNDIDDEIYIGSTVCELYKRYHQHSSGGSRNNGMRVVQKIRECGKSHFRIILLENYPCNSKDELKAREQFYIEQLKPALNTNRANCTIENKRADKARWGKTYYESHRNKIKSYREKNKSKIRETMRLYREENKERISDIRRQYIVKNKDRFNCPACDYHTYDISKFKRHCTVPKHLANTPSITFEEGTS
jgi:group I intron endonuclease